MQLFLSPPKKELDLSKHLPNETTSPVWQVVAVLRCNCSFIVLLLGRQVAVDWFYHQGAGENGDWVMISLAYVAHRCDWICDVDT